MKTIFCIIFLFGLLNNIFSQKNEHFYLKGKTELYTSVSFINNAVTNNDYSIQIQPSYFLFENFSFGSRLNFNSIKYVDISVIVEASIPILSNKIMPYILIGYGYNFHVQDVNLHSNFNLMDYRLSKLFTIGSGIKIPVYSNFYLRFELCYTDRPDNKYESAKSNILSLVNPEKSSDIFNQDYNYSIGLSLFL